MPKRGQPNIPECFVWDYSQLDVVDDYGISDEERKEILRKSGLDLDLNAAPADAPSDQDKGLYKAKPILFALDAPPSSPLPSSLGGTDNGNSPQSAQGAQSAQGQTPGQASSAQPQAQSQAPPQAPPAPPPDAASVQAHGVVQSLQLSQAERGKLIGQHRQRIPHASLTMVKAAESDFRGGKDTAGKYAPKGKYSSQRESLHDKILFSPDFLGSSRGAPATMQPPTALILGGPPGADKQKLLQEVADPKDFLLLDPDSVKGMLPEYNGKNSPVVHREASYLMDRILQPAILQGRNIAFFASLRDASSWGQMIDQLRQAGYQIEGHHISASLEKLLQRAAGRFIHNAESHEAGAIPHPGHYTPLELISGEYNSSHDAFDALAQGGKFDKWSKWDNNGDFPTKVGEGAGGSPPPQADQAQPSDQSQSQDQSQQQQAMPPGQPQQPAEQSNERYPNATAGAAAAAR
jgi:hypothetical protein